MRVQTIAAAAATLALVLGPGCQNSAAAAETVLRVANWVPPTHLIVRDILTPWADQVAQVTQGRVRLEILASPLGKPQTHFDIARDGLADIAYGVHGYTPGRFVLPQLAELPFLGTSAEALSVALWRVHSQFLAPADEYREVKLLTLWAHGPGHIFTSKAPIQTVADFKGLKFRVGGGLIGKIAEVLGTVPVPSPSTQAYELLSNGVADGIFFPLESVAFFNLTKLVPNATLVPGGLYSSSFFLIANQANWRKLDAADRAAIEAISGEALARKAGQAWDAEDRRGLETLRQSGGTIIEASPEMRRDLGERLAFLEGDWIAAAAGRGVDGAAALAALRAEIAKAR